VKLSLAYCSHLFHNEKVGETGESSKQDSDLLSLCETGESSKPDSASLSLCETVEQ
jgi:hypothetical protein